MNFSPGNAKEKRRILQETGDSTGSAATGASRNSRSVRLCGQRRCSALPGIALITLGRAQLVKGMYSSSNPHRLILVSRASPAKACKSLSENCQGPCGEGFWRWPRRRDPSIPAAGCKDRANEGQRQKSRRPEGFRGKSRLASLLLCQRPLAGILPRRASPSGPFRENRASRNFQTGS